MLEGTIIKQISNQYTVLCHDKTYICTPRGKFRNMGISPFVGDKVLVQDEKTITTILPRKNELHRPTVANVDYALLVTSLKQPDLSLSLLDKQIAYILLHQVRPILCFTKLDLIEDQEKEELQSLRTYYESIGIPTFTNTDILSLKEFLQGKFVVLTGQSGAGKSSLLNKMDETLQLKTNEISLSLNRGKHTTRHVEIFSISGIFFFDTPGFSSLDLKEFQKEKLQQGFPEFVSYRCRFKDCLHDKEMDCAVKEAVEKGLIRRSRYVNYIKFLKEEGK